MSKTKILLAGIGGLPVVLLGGAFAARKRFNRMVAEEVGALFEKGKKMSGRYRKQTSKGCLMRSGDGLEIPASWNVGI